MPDAINKLIEIERYDSGYLNDYGGGNVSWWQDYIRAELARAHDHYERQFDSFQEEQSKHNNVTTTAWQPIESAPLDGKPLLLGWYTTWPEVMWVCAIAPAGMEGGKQGQNYRHGMATHWKPHPEIMQLNEMPPLCGNCQSFMPGGCRGLFESDEACMRRERPEGIKE